MKKKEKMKDNFDALVEHLIGASFFMEEAVELLERSFIVRALVQTAGKKLPAAKLLGIHRNTLQRKMLEYKLEQPKVRRKPARRAAAGKKSVKAS